MRFLADESLEARIVLVLREAGHDVGYVTEEHPGTPDEEVLRWAVEEDRILLTNDKDFAELAFLQQHAAFGIILVRMPRYATRAKGERLREVMAQEHRFHGA